MFRPSLSRHAASGSSYGGGCRLLLIWYFGTWCSFQKAVIPVLNPPTWPQSVRIGKVCVQKHWINEIGITTKFNVAFYCSLHSYWYSDHQLPSFLYLHRRAFQGWDLLLSTFAWSHLLPRLPHLLSNCSNWPKAPMSMFIVHWTLSTLERSRANDWNNPSWEIVWPCRSWSWVGGQGRGRCSCVSTCPTWIHSLSWDWLLPESTEGGTSLSPNCIFEHTLNQQVLCGNPEKRGNIM